MDSIRGHLGFNILNHPIGQIGRGMGCSLQTCLHLKVANLSIVPCHRTAYEFMETGKYRVEENKIVGIEGKNVELMSSTQSQNNKISPLCEKCVISQLCQGGCLGSQYETTGDLYNPIPSVCRANHYKIQGFYESWKELGILPNILGLLSDEKREALIKFIREVCNDTTI
jgi:radical SAM protein with 4Fe4S-binding SPASM domain